MKTIAIHLRLETASHRKRLMGIFRSFGSSSGWDIRIVPNEDILCDLLAAPPSDRPDGIVSGVPYSDRTRAAIVSSGVPFVGIGMSESELPVRSTSCGFVLNDNEGIGRAAAGHFLSLGVFRSYAFVPDFRGRAWSRLRGDAFAAALAAAGKRCETFRPPARDMASLVGFLSALPKPTAVFAAWDGQGADVIHAAHKAALRVPEDVSVLGVDDDDMICEHTTPTLSSIRTNAEGMGEAAARMLVSLVSRKSSRPARSVRCPILGLTERCSTRMTSPAASLIERAIAFINAEAVNGITPDDVAKYLKVSRRLLDLRFRQYESRSVAGCITSHKLEHALNLLATSKAQVKDIFAQSGFGNVAYATKLFRSTFGSTPEEWRRVHGAPPPAAASKGPELLDVLSGDDAARLAALVRQLSPDVRFDASALRDSMRGGRTLVFVRRCRGAIVATATAVLFATPTGSHCRLEDVVVDERHRGKGLGRKLVTDVLAALRERGIRVLELTSRPSRLAANALYRSLGFALRKTNVYECHLDGPAASCPSA